MSWSFVTHFAKRSHLYLQEKSPNWVNYSLNEGSLVPLDQKIQNLAVQSTSEKEFIGHFPRFVEDLMHGRFKDLSFCVQYPGNTISFPVLTGHFMISATLFNERQVLLTQKYVSVFWLFAAFALRLFFPFFCCSFLRSFRFLQTFSPGAVFSVLFFA